MLVATDVAARGLDIDDIDVVIQQSLNNVDSFVHRTGRTGRAGKSGRNIVLYETNGIKHSLDFYEKLEESLKCNFKYSNAILSDTSVNQSEREEQERKNLFKLEKGIVKLAQTTP